MIVTVSIREENSEEQRSVSASVAVKLTTMESIELAIADAGDDAIDAARAKGWLI